jgi:hypothetical protein
VKPIVEMRTDTTPEGLRFGTPTMTTKTDTNK